MRPRHLIYKSIRDVLGGVERAAEIADVEPGTWRKYEEDPELSGREMPLPTFIKIIGELARIPSTNAQEVLDELLTHIGIPARRKFVTNDWLEHWEKDLTSIKNGKSISMNGFGREALRLHGPCGSPVQIIEVCSVCRLGS